MLTRRLSAVIDAAVIIILCIVWPLSYRVAVDVRILRGPWLLCAAIARGQLEFCARSDRNAEDYSAARQASALHVGSAQLGGRETILYRFHPVAPDDTAADAAYTE